MNIEKFIMQQYQDKIYRLQKELDKLKRELKDFDPKTGLRKLQTREQENEQSTKTSRD